MIGRLAAPSPEAATHRHGAEGFIECSRTLGGPSAGLVPVNLKVPSYDVGLVVPVQWRGLQSARRVSACHPRIARVMAQLWLSPIRRIWGRLDETRRCNGEGQQTFWPQGSVVRGHKIHVADADGLRQLVQRYDRRVALTPLKPTQVLLAEA